MEDLIKALQIFLKYKNPEWPTTTAHDELIICEVTYEEVSEEDKEKLKALNFFWSEDEEYWFRYSDLKRLMRLAKKVRKQ